ncbi:transposase [Shimia thalassica]|uniref:transposase n=1 Tax=Shimia thalassica TaxID=1715693 RepID=UPI003F731F5F
MFQIIKEQEAGERTADVCGRYGISRGSLNKYKSKFGGMERSDAKSCMCLRLRMPNSRSCWRDS